MQHISGNDSTTSPTILWLEYLGPLRAYSPSRNPSLPSNAQLCGTEGRWLGHVQRVGVLLNSSEVECTSSRFHPWCLNSVPGRRSLLLQPVCRRLVQVRLRFNGGPFAVEFEFVKVKFNSYQTINPNL